MMITHADLTEFQQKRQYWNKKVIIVDINIIIDLFDRKIVLKWLGATSHNL